MCVLPGVLRCLRFLPLLAFRPVDREYILFWITFAERVGSSSLPWREFSDVALGVFFSNMLFYGTASGCYLYFVSVVGGVSSTVIFVGFKSLDFNVPCLNKLHSLSILSSFFIIAS